MCLNFYNCFWFTWIIKKIKLNKVININGINKNIHTGNNQSNICYQNQGIWNHHYIDLFDYVNLDFDHLYIDHMDFDNFYFVQFEFDHLDFDHYDNCFWFTQADQIDYSN